MGQDDDLCGLCIKESHTEYFPSAATAHRFYDQREVVRIGESVHNLVQHGITKQTAIVLNYPGFTFKSDPAAYDDYRRRPGLLTKARKVTGPDDDDVLSRVILFATFDGCVPLRTDLPKVLQWFSIPVMPHVAVLTGTERTHIHTTPEWSNSSKSSEPINAWVIAREYLSRGYIDCWWRNENRTRPGSSFKVDWDVWADINEAMDCLWDTWLDKCRESRGVLEEYQREYLECVATLAKKQEAIRLREAEKARAAEKPKEAVEHRAVQVRPGMSTTPQCVSPTKPSPQVGRQPATPVTADKSFASVLGSGSRQKAAAQTQMASASVPQDPSAAQQRRVTRPSAMERLKALFAPSKAPVNGPVPRDPMLIPNIPTRTRP